MEHLAHRTLLRISVILIIVWGLSSLCGCQKSRGIPEGRRIYKTIKLADSKQKLKYAVIANNLFVPWDLVWGPDDWLWFTQRNGEVRKLDPKSGKLIDLLTLEDNYEWTSSGTLGLLLHQSPDSLHAYITYTFTNTGSPEGIHEKCVRYSYDKTNERLVHPVVIRDSIFCGRGGTFGSRLLLTPDDKILMTTGCMTPPDENYFFDGGNILRMELDGSIPTDNPFPKSAVYTYGHRNPQGLVYGRNNILYSSEHGPTSDDELNIITAGKNYGWPEVWGMCNLDGEKKYCDSFDVQEPLKAWTPTIAPCGLAYYDHSAIPEWKNSLLLATLREKDLRVLKLDDDGQQIIKEQIIFDEVLGRIRDVCIAPNGDVYLSTSHFEKEDADLNIKAESTQYDKIVVIRPK